MKRHFVHPEERPPELAALDIAELDPALRTLLFTDGTVTRTLEVQTLSPVRVAVVDQHRCPPSKHAARYLGLADHEDCIRRRIEMFVGESQAPAVWAESHIIPGRLPGEFLDLLARSPEGIGAALQALMVENARELLWFGRGRSPEWATTASTPDVLMRIYRVTAHGETALLISESFAIANGSGEYSLAVERGRGAR